ncbi:MAG TPA: C-terminal binding protein [Solirubrobacteraceae bacterium]|nr:C-terminal binding protein [Solirubrobacteraceae bacterium]
MPAATVLIDACLELAAIRALLADTALTAERLGSFAGDPEDVIAVVVWEQRFGAAELARMPNLRLVMAPSVGFDHIDLDAARRHGGIYVCHVPDYCVDEMADSAVALALALLRGIVALDRHVRSGGWDSAAAGPLRRISGTRFGVIGFGRIGAAVARRAHSLGFTVAATDPLVPPGRMLSHAVDPASLDELLRTCHVVSLHVPLTPETEGMIGAAEIARMPRGSYLVNTARGELVDTPAVLAALASGHLAGAALDVLAAEPPTAEAPAPRADTLIVTPHAAYHSPEADEELHRRVADAVRTVAAGGVPRNVLVEPAGAEAPSAA